MKFLVLFSCIVATCLAGANAASSSVADLKDAVFGFGLMINKVTGRNPYDFCGYGNYCGKGGSGTAVDAIDSCCKAHDACYSNIKATFLGWNYCLPHLDIYGFGYNSATNTVSCNTVGFLDPGGCAKKACECDATAALCFKRNLASYKKANHNGFLKCVWN